MDDKTLSPLAPPRQPLQEGGQLSYGTSRGSNAAAEELNLRQAWFILKHRWRLVLAVTCGVTVAVGVWTFQQTPTYQGKFQLLVGDPISQQSGVNPVLLDQLGVREVDYDTQIAVLRSSSVLKPIVQEIQKQYPEVDYDLLAGGNRPLLAISQLKETKILEVAYLGIDRAQIEFVLNELAQAYLRYSLEERKVQINQGIKFVDDQLPKLREQVNRRQAQLQRFRQQYNLLDPEQRARELSELEFKLQAQYLDLQMALREAVSLNSLLKAQLGLSPDNAIASSFLSESPRYQNLLNELQAVELELVRESSRYSDDSPVVQTLKEKRARLIPLLRQEAQSVLGPRFNPEQMKTGDLTSPSNLRLGLNQQYIQTTNQVQVLEQKKVALEKQIKDLEQQIKLMPSIARQYMDLQREITVANDGLSRFLEAQQKLQIDAAQQTVPWQLISPPSVADTPVWPKPVRNLTLGLIAGTLLGMGAAFLLERLDPVFHSVEEVKENSQIPILGMIPWQKDLQVMEKVVGINLSPMTGGAVTPPKMPNPRSLSRGYRSSGFLEAFRSLNTSLWLLGADHPIRSVVISSATPGDGKSTTCLHLAQAAAAMGQKILLVDADLRRPRIHQYFGLLNTQGLSNVIATGLSPEEAIQRVPQWDNLSVLTAGDLPPDPIRLLTSRRMQELMEGWEQSQAYDLVIYDTPPLLNFADARILGATTAGIIVVVKLGKTDRSAFQQILDDLKMAQTPILGLVTNSVSRNDYGSYNYYRYNKG